MNLTDVIAPIEFIDDETRVKVPFELQTDPAFPLYRSTLFYTLEEWGELTPTQLAETEAQRYAQWYAIVNPPPPPPPTVEELLVQVGDFDAQLFDLANERAAVVETIYILDAEASVPPFPFLPGM